MAITKAFKLAELIRHIEYDSTDDVIKTIKKHKIKTKREAHQQRLQLLSLILILLLMHDFRFARYIVAMSRGTDFHSTEIMLVHDGSVVTLTAYGTLKDTLATFDADISGANVRLRCTPASSDSTVIKFDRTLVDA